MFGSVATNDYWKHSSKTHKVFDAWKGKIQVTNADELMDKYRDYNLVVILTDKMLPTGVPFSLGVERIRTKTKFIYYIIPDRKVPVEGFYWRWLRDTIVKALKKGETVGLACMGGHGRSGTIATVIYGLFLAEQKSTENPISKIRELVGCEELVESKQQEAFVYSQTGFPAPAKSLASDVQWDKKEASSSSSSGGFIWYDRDGNEVNALSFEPKELWKLPFVKAKDSITGVAYVVVKKKQIAIPIEVDDKGKPKSLPAKICGRCSCARAYTLPVHKGSHLKCIVCPELNLLGATKTKKIVNPIPPMQKVLDSKKKENGDDLCDNCGEKIDLKNCSFSFLQSETLQFCNSKCTEEYNKKVFGAPKSQSDMKGGIGSGCYNMPCDAYIDGQFCDDTKTIFTKTIDDKLLYFCSWIHMTRERDRREKATGKGEVIPFRKKEEKVTDETFPQAQGNA